MSARRAGGTGETGRGRNALVVDWDYFMENPLMTTPKGREVEWFLYDWCYSEPYGGHSKLDLLGPLGAYIWHTRARNFPARGFPLPRCQGWETFWDRFAALADAPLFYADSNLYAAPSKGFLPDGDGPWARIDLYDAHHDCGYPGSSEEPDCGNWMAMHRRHGTADLRVHYPAWRPSLDVAGEGPPQVHVRRRIDPGGPVRVRYDAVFLCRSGEWVPPWCDDQFQDFLERYPGPVVRVGPLPERPFDPELAELGGRVSRVTLRPGGLSAVTSALGTLQRGGQVDLSGDPELAEAVRLVREGLVTL